MKNEDNVLDQFRLFAVLFLGAVIVLMGSMWIVYGNEFFLAKFFGPKNEQTRRETFEESKAYNEGMAQELRRMQLEYVKASPDQKQAIASIILHQTAGYDTTKLPPDLQRFVDDVKKGQGL